ncbi:hypothetical protein [Microvirgula aerodenitrificans]|nr:hypothetical protein [Microvirgula aerodenitrificans]
MLSGTLKSMASGGAQSLVHGVRPNWGRIAAESFGSNVGHQVAGSAVERDREQQQQRQPQAIRREVAGQNDAIGYRDDGGLQARAETVWRQQERGRQAAIAEVQSLERGADVSLNGEAILDEIVVTASRLPPGDEPGAMQRARDAYSEALKDALIGTGQILSDQMYFMASRASGGLIDDRGAAARNVELVRGTMDAIAGIPRQFAVGMYYLAHPGELNAEQIGRAMGGAAAGYAGGRVVAGLRGKGGVGYAGGGEGGPSSAIFNNLRSPSELMGIEPSSQELLAAVGNKRSLIIAMPGSDDLRMLDYFGAEASVGGINNTSIIVRQSPSKVAVLEEFLHGTQSRLGVIDRLGTSGFGSAETHVKDFMIRHQKMLGLSADDVRILQMLRDKGL